MMKQIGFRLIQIIVTAVVVGSMSFHEAFAQTTARLDGTVKDATGAAVAQASVVVTNIQTNTVVTTATDGEGVFVLAQMPVGVYRVTIEAPGFKKAVVEGIKIDVAIPATVNVALEVGQVTEVVEVTASEGQAVINTVNAELNTVVNERQILDLPLNGRNPIQLAGLQAGVASAAGSGNPRNARINGLRGSYNNLTHDGVNIQDNFIRTGGLFAQSAPGVDNTAEFSITTQGAGAETGTGVTQIRLVTPSGTNQIHGSVYEFHRNTVLDANDFFNNASRLEREKLLRNQFGFRLGGPAIKNKLFYFGYLELFRESRDASIARNVLTTPLRQGLFTYPRQDNGQLETVNLLQLAGGRTLDPVVQRLMNLTPLPNDPSSTDPNLRLFRFNSSRPTESENWSFRIDYAHSQNHSLEGIYQQFHFRFPNDTPNDIGEMFPGLPGAGQQSLRKRFSTAWRATLTSSLSNELRFGFTHAPVKFFTNEEFADGFLLGPNSTTRNIFVDIPGSDPDSPVRNFMPQGRSAPTFEWLDNAAWVKGNHNIRFGGNVRYYYADPFNDAGIVPEFELGFGATNNVNPLTTQLFPGRISANDFARATGYLAMLTGSVTRVDQTFNVTSRDSGFVPGATEKRNIRQSVVGLYAGDTWRFSPNLTVNVGLRYEYYTPVRERDGLTLLPVGGSSAVLNPQAVLDFDGGRNSLYNADKNNFAPNISFAWDPFGSGRTSIRAGYSISYVIDSDLTAVRNAFRANDGLVATRTLTNLSGTAGAGGIVTVAPPTLQVPRTIVDNVVQFTPTPTLFTVDPNYRTPYVQQWSLSVEREILRDTAFEIRYVGNRGTKLGRAIDLNQVNPNGANGQFIRDFLAAQRNLINNGDPYRGEPIPTFELLGGRGLLNSFRTQLLNGEVGQLIALYMANRRLLFLSPDPARFPSAAGAQVGAEFFFPNGTAQIGDVLENGSYSTYHGLQAELRRRFTSGLYFQANYTYSKNLTDFNGSDTNFEAALDIFRPALEKRRSNQDINHIFNANFLYELPIGPGKSFLNTSGISGKILGGWQLAGIFNWQSGEPVSIVSARGTFNRGARSARNTVNTDLTTDQLKEGTGLFYLPDGRPVLFDPRFFNLSSTGAILGASTSLFRNPAAGEVGSLALTPVTGPSFFNVDASIIKRTNITESINVEFRAEFFNVLNHTNFDLLAAGPNQLEQNINSPDFGVFTSAFSPRIIQFAMKVNF